MPFTNTEKHITYFPNPVDDMLAQSPNLKTLKITSEISKKFSILIIGNIGRVQGYKTILRAAKTISEFDDIRIYFIGEGSMLGNLKKKIFKQIELA